jgi:hypothetical protein
MKKGLLKWSFLVFSMLVSFAYNAQNFVLTMPNTDTTNCNGIAKIDTTIFQSTNWYWTNSASNVLQQGGNQLNNLCAGTYTAQIADANNCLFFQSVVITEPQTIDDNEIIVEVDGDDWLPDPYTLTRINDVYSDQNVWVANGSFRYHDGRPGFSSAQRDLHNLRNVRFTASHIRTWRAFLWRKIKQEDLKDENGQYWKVTGDLSFMYPMLEMSGEEHYRFMPEINYVYNESNPINDHKVDMSLVTSIANKIRTKEKYNKL